MATLTKRQKQILDYIQGFIDENGYSPTFEEIRKHFRLSALSTIHQHIDTLSSKGYLSRNDHAARGIELRSSESMVSIPLEGMIAAGQPIEAISQKESIAIPKGRLPGQGKFYALRVVGNSMTDENINDGDIVLVKHQFTAENGQKVVALIDNHEATLKKFYKERGSIRLKPANKRMQSLVFQNKNSVSVQGVVLDVIKKGATQKTYQPTDKTRERCEDLPLNKIICGDAVEVLRKIPSNSIDLAVTSPPYDDIRAYNGFSLNLPAVGIELYRVLKEGGIVAMVIQDATRNFGKTLTSFRTIIDWCDNAGFKLFENVIYRKYGTEGAWWKYRFRVDHEYMPIFLKGERPIYFNKEPLKIPSKHAGKIMTGSGNRRTDGTTTNTVTREINTMKCRGTVWDYLNAGDKNPLKRRHPATFPDKIPTDFIQCFCPPKGIVLDPFIGSGSTAVAAKRLGRKYIGIDISQEYCKLAEDRIRSVGDSLFE